MTHFKMLNPPHHLRVDFPTVPEYEGPKKYEAIVLSFQTSLGRPDPVGGAKGDSWENWTFGEGFDQGDRNHSIGLHYPVHILEPSEEFSEGILERSVNLYPEEGIDTDVHFLRSYNLHPEEGYISTLNQWRHRLLHWPWRTKDIWKKRRFPHCEERVEELLEEAFQKKGPSHEIWVKTSEGWWMFLCSKGLNPKWRFLIETGKRETILEASLGSL